MSYLDPKNDLTFKKVFGQHPNLCISLLNSLLPLPGGEYVEEIEYMSSELVPELPLGKTSIVDVCCKDNKGRQFIVEMQMFWTDSFQYRVVFNASKAFVRQLGRGKQYKSLQPVYSLNLVNENYTQDANEFYHHYKIVNIQNTNEQLKGLEFVFIELKKFQPQNVKERKMMVLWLRYLTEINDGTKVVSKDLTDSLEIGQALDIIKESAFTEEEIRWYDKYWDIISTERTYLSDSKIEGLIEGKIEGMIEGKIEVAVKLLDKGFSVEEIKEITGLNDAEIEKLKRMIK